MGGCASSAKDKKKKGKKNKEEDEGEGIASTTLNDKLTSHSATFEEECLETHNKFRKKHHSPPLELNKELNKIAETYAQKLAKSNKFEHSTNTWKGEDLGENLYKCSGFPINAMEMVTSWYNEIKDYKYGNNKAPGTGHFTQVVWKKSQLVGVGWAQSKSGAYYGVCNYYPAGNWKNQYEENVLRP